MREEIKTALEISHNTTQFDSEIDNLINAGVIDLHIGGVDSDAVSSSSADSMVKQALITYVCYNFSLIHGNLQRADAMKKAYDEYKAQMGMATGYTTGGDFNVDTDND